MASKCSIKIGFVYTAPVEEGSDVYAPVCIEKPYRGEIVGNLNRRLYLSDQINHDIGVSCKIKVLLNAFIRHRFSSIRYVEYMGVKWTAESVDILYPNIEISLGGIYNGNTESPQTDTQG